MDATWNDEAAGKLVEKRMNLAVTYADAWLHLIRAARFCGQVVTGDRAVGIDPGARRGDGFHLLPDLGFYLLPDLKNPESAYPGEYRDDVMGQLVIDPNLQVSWEITAPAKPPSDFWRPFGRRKGGGPASRGPTLTSTLATTVSSLAASCSACRAKPVGRCFACSLAPTCSAWPGRRPPASCRFRRGGRRGAPPRCRLGDG